MSTESLLSQKQSWLEVDLNALRQNVYVIRSLLERDCDMIAVVKSDAYGLGAVRIAKTLQNSGLTHLAVGTFEEAIELRRARVLCGIMILGSADLNDANLSEMVRLVIQPTICTVDDIKRIEMFKSKRPNLELKIHLKIDTGFSRLGIAWHDCGTYIRRLFAIRGVRILTIFTHLASPDIHASTFAMRQFQRFTQIKTFVPKYQIPPKFHIANSAAMLLHKSLHLDQVRVGLALFGASPFEDRELDNGIKQALKLAARIIDIKEIKAGETIGYGEYYISRKDLRIAILKVGYSSGIPRQASGKIKAIVRGEYAMQIGVVTMEYLMLDISNIPYAKVGDLAVLIGEHEGKRISLWDLAKASSTIPWDIACSVGSRMHKHYTNELDDCSGNN